MEINLEITKEQLENRIVACYALSKKLKEDNEKIEIESLLCTNGEKMDNLMEMHSDNLSTIEKLKEIEKDNHKKLVKLLCH